MTEIDLDSLNRLRENMVKNFDDMMDSKTNIIKWANSRYTASKKEAFTFSDKKHSEVIRNTSKLIDEYENLYESNDTLYTNQRKMQFQNEAYERIRSWRWLLFIPYYLLLGMVIFEGNTHYVLWLLYASLPLWVDRLIESLKWLGKTTNKVFFNI